MSPLKGDAGFKYNPGGGEVTVALNFPLFRIYPADVLHRRTTWSLSKRVSETLAVGVSTPEIVASIRFHPSGLELLAMLVAGANGVTLNYYPSLAGGTFYPCRLIEPDGERIESWRDSSERGRFGEYENQIRLRRVDGGNFNGLFP